jgi:predicted DNA-binding transcriptional regulator AlpA
MKILREPAVREKLGIGRSYFREKYINTGRLRAIPLGERAVGYAEDEVDQLVENLRRERDGAASLIGGQVDLDDDEACIERLRELDQLLIATGTTSKKTNGAGWYEQHVEACVALARLLQQKAAGRGEAGRSGRARARAQARRARPLPAIMVTEAG